MAWVAGTGGVHRRSARRPRPASGPHRLRLGLALRLGLEGWGPVVRHRATGVLPGLRGVAVVAHHRVEEALQLGVTTTDGVAHPLVAAVGPHPLELLVQVEHQRGHRGPSGYAGCVGVQADDEEGRAGDAEREVGVVGVGRDASAHGASSWSCRCCKAPHSSASNSPSSRGTGSRKHATNETRSPSGSTSWAYWASAPPRVSSVPPGWCRRGRRAPRGWRRHAGRPIGRPGTGTPGAPPSPRPRPRCRRVGRRRGPRTRAPPGPPPASRSCCVGGSGGHAASWGRASHGPPYPQPSRGMPTGSAPVEPSTVSRSTG